MSALCPDSDTSGRPIREKDVVRFLLVPGTSWEFQIATLNSLGELELRDLNNNRAVWEMWGAFQNLGPLSEQPDSIRELFED